jgi:hypothetical protein
MNAGATPLADRARVHFLYPPLSKREDQEQPPQRAAARLSTSWGE